LHHFSVKGANDCKRKAIKYAILGAQKCYLQGKKATQLKRFGSPVFNFIKNYILYLGVLDGNEGWTMAITSVKRDVIFLTFMLLIAVVSLSENIFDVDKGTMFYGLFYSFFIFCNRADNIENHRLADKYILTNGQPV
jgi:hypothetical protein